MAMNRSAPTFVVWFHLPAPAALPRHAIASGIVDMVLPASQMASALTRHIEYHRDIASRKLPSIIDEIFRYLPELATLLRRKTGHDFSQYKPNTIVRRTQRRMQLLHIESVEVFLRRLREDASETEALFKDLLIGVTYFFRDKEAFRALSRIAIPELLRDKAADDTVRLWVPGCSTGEESYSLAILLRESMAKLDTVPRVQIFASDIDNDALNVGRAALYGTSIVDQVSSERLERFFIKTGNGYKLNKDIRDMCLFSEHNLIKDPPFSRLNFLSCRNVLIYLDSDLQRRLMHLFHYALRPGGFLFLGPSESVSGHTDLFDPVEKSMGIYRRREAVMHTPVDFPVTDSRFMLHRMPDHVTPAKAAASDIPRSVERLLLANYAPACVVINSLNEGVYFTGHTGRFLEPPPGHPTHDIIEMARRGLRTELRSALYEARKLRCKVVRPGVQVQTNGHIDEIELVVQPLNPSEPEPALYLIIFQDTHPAAPVTRRLPEAVSSGASADSVTTLEEELNATKQHLQTTVEELEASNEELKSMNEELLSMNEELQSSNEELETSREELQSVNEELETVNAELASKVQELGRANDDLKNLLESTQIATIFLDNSFRIKGFTPAITEIFNLIDTDIGRPITDIASRFALGDLLTDSRQVLRSLAPRERQLRVADSADGWHLMRILPYRTQENVIDGVVVSFVDIREVKQAEESVKRSEARFRSISDSEMIGIAFFDRSGRVTQANHAFLTLTGYGSGDVEAGRLRWDRLLPADTDQKFKQVIEQLQSTGTVRDREYEFIRSDGVRFWAVFGCALVDGTSSLEAVGFLLDITHRKKTEQHQQTLVDELDHRVKNTLAVVDALCSQTAREHRSVHEFEEALRGRIQALAHAHRELSRAQWRGTELATLLQHVVAPYASSVPGRIEMTGADVVLSPHAGLDAGASRVDDQRREAWRARNRERSSESCLDGSAGRRTCSCHQVVRRSRCHARSASGTGIWHPADRANRPARFRGKAVGEL